jgi:hypothetical protein
MFCVAMARGSSIAKNLYAMLARAFFKTLKVIVDIEGEC